MLTSGEHKLYFFISTAMWLRKYDVFDLSLDHKIEVSRDFLGGATGLVNKDKDFLICHVTTWSMCHVTLWVESSYPKSPTGRVWGP